MQAGTLRIRFDRKTGRELDREIIETFEISEEAYAEKLVMAMTGMSPASAAKDFLSKFESENSQDNTMKGASIYAINTSLQVHNF